MVNVRILLFLALLLACSVVPVLAQAKFRLGYLQEADCSEWTFFAGTSQKAMREEKTILQTGHRCSQRIKINGREIPLTTVNGDLPEANWKVGRGGYEILKG